MKVRCSTCSAGRAIARFVDSNRDLSAAALSRQAEAMGMDLSADRIRTHRAHRLDEGDTAAAKTKRDAAVFIRDRIMDKLEDIDDTPLENGQENMALLDKALQPAVGSMLKAQALLDKREQSKGPVDSTVAFAIIAMLTGKPAVAALDDGMTIDGEATEVFDAE